MAEKPSKERREQLDQCAKEARAKIYEVFAGTLHQATPIERVYLIDAMMLQELESFDQEKPAEAMFALRFVKHMAQGYLLMLP